MVADEGSTSVGPPPVVGVAEGSGRCRTGGRETWGVLLCVGWSLLVSGHTVAKAVGTWVCRAE